MIIFLKDLKKLKGQKTVYVGGVFDLTHYGHIFYIKKVKDNFPKHKIVVGIVPDKRVTFKKGETRPILKQTERAKIMDSLRNVDYVSIMPVKGNGTKGTTAMFIKQFDPEFAVFAEQKYLNIKKELDGNITKVVCISRTKPFINSTTTIIKKIVEKHI